MSWTFQVLNKYLNELKIGLIENVKLCLFHLNPPPRPYNLLLHFVSCLAQEL